MNGPAFTPLNSLCPKNIRKTVLGLFADDPVRTKESSGGRFAAFTIEMHVRSSDEVIAIYQRVTQIPDVISL